MKPQRSLYNRWNNNTIYITDETTSSSNFNRNWTGVSHQRNSFLLSLEYKFCCDEKLFRVTHKPEI